MLRAIVAPQRVKMKDPGSALHTGEELVHRYNKKNAEFVEVEFAHDIKVQCS